MRFASDNSGPVHPKVIEALTAANQGWAMPYGNDAWTERAVERVKNVFEAPDAAVFFVTSGTAANALLLATMAQPFQTIFCTPESHIHEDECNAPEFFTGGAKLTLIDGPGAKMDPDNLAHAIAKLQTGGVHSAQPGPVTITQITERGTLYSLDEIRAINSVAKDHGLPLHLDGARLANALISLGTSPAEMTWRSGVDAVSFGGTKNGLMGVEAVVIFDPEKAWEFQLRRKRGGHLSSKNRFLAAQISAYLTDDLWLDMARRANSSAANLARGLGHLPDVSFLFEPQANMLFPSFPRAAHHRLQDAGAVYYLWEDDLESDSGQPLAARLVCDWSCPEENIRDFIGLVAG